MRKFLFYFLLSIGAMAKPMKTSPMMVGGLAELVPKHDGVHYFIQKEPSSKPVDVKADDVRNAVKNARAAGKIVNDFLSVHIQSDLPVIVQKELGGVTYEILLDKLIFTPTGNTISIAGLITMANGDSFAFGGENVKFSGQGGIESGGLTLLIENNSQLKTQQLNDKVKVALKGGGFTFDCDGFKDFSLYGSVTFSRELLVPESEDSSARFINPVGVVESDFKLDRIRDFNDLIIEISMPAFQFTKMKGFGFEVSKAIIDLSAKNNAPFYRLPKGYVPDVNGVGWMGVSINSLKVNFPPEFDNRVSKKRISAEAQGILIDKYGFSGQVTGKNILDLDSGNASGWDISVDDVGLFFLKSQVTGGSLKGSIRPAVIDKKEQALEYIAQFDPIRDYYNFAVTAKDTIQFPFLKAGNVTLNENSNIRFTVANQRFKAKANLSGLLNIQADSLTLKSYKFESLIVSTQPPYLFVGYFGKTTSVKNAETGKTDDFNGFSVVMKEPKMVSKEESVAISLGLLLNLDKMGVSAEGDFVIEGQFDNRAGRHYWKNTKVALGKVKVSADINPIKFTGELQFIKNDPVYGKAFVGRLRAEVNMDSKYTIDAAALFGNKNKNKYWFVDLLYEPGKGSSDKTKGFKINLLSGFFYKHMRASRSGGSGPRTLTGMLYEPDFSINWGAKAAIGLEKVGGKSLAGFGGFEVEARADNSISKIGIMANISFGGDDSTVDPEVVKKMFFAMSTSPNLSAPGGITSKLAKAPSSEKESFKPFSPPSSPTTGITAYAMIKFDFDQHSFYGELGADATLKGGTRIAGMGAILISPDKNFFHLGEPPSGRRILVKTPSLPQFDGYFMIGDIVPELPAPFPNIFATYPAEEANRTPNNVQSVISGKGIAFGAAVEVSNANSYKVLSWNLGVRAGLDMVLVRYPNGTYCVGKVGSEFGFNNWRAMGQLYMIGWFNFQALGIPVLNLGIGAILKGSTPNPTNASGQVVVSFRVLFKKYDYKAQFQVGEECELITGEESITDLPIITNVFPANESTISDERLIGFETVEEFNSNLTNISNPAQLKVVAYKLFKGGNELNGQYSINGKNVYYMPSRPLENNTRYNYYIKVQAQEMVAGNWQPVLIDGREVSDVKEGWFKFEKTAEQQGEEIKKLGEKAADNISKIGEKYRALLTKYMGQDTATINRLSETALKALNDMLIACGDDEECVKKGLIAAKLITDEKIKTNEDINKIAINYEAKIRAAIAADSALAIQAGLAAQIEILKNGGDRKIAMWDNFKANFRQSIIDLNCNDFLASKNRNVVEIINNPSILNTIIDDKGTGCVEKIRGLKVKFEDEKNRIANYYADINNGIVSNTVAEVIRLQKNAEQVAAKLVDKATELSQAEIVSYRKLIERVITSTFTELNKKENFNTKISTADLDAYIKSFDKIAVGEEPYLTCSQLKEPTTAAIVVVGDESKELTLSADGCIAGSRYKWDYVNRDNLSKSVEGKTIIVNDYTLETTFTVACVSKGCDAGKKKDDFEVSIQKTKKDGCRYINAPRITYSTLKITEGDEAKVNATGCTTGYEWSTGRLSETVNDEIMLSPTATTKYWIRCRNTELSQTTTSGRTTIENRDVTGNTARGGTTTTTCKNEYLKWDFTIEINNNCGLTSPYTLVQKMVLGKNEKFELMGYGCSTGKFFWTSTGAPGTADLNVNPLPISLTTSTKYQLYCKSTSCNLDPSKIILSEITEFIVSEKDSNGLCISLKPTIAASRVTITDIQDPTQGVTLTASGCPTGSEYTWSLKFPNGQYYKGEIISFSTPQSSFDVSVYCQFASCPGANSSKLAIKVTDPCIGLSTPNITASLDGRDFASGTSLRLTSTGCPASNLVWSNGSTGVSSIDFVADINNSTRSYSVQCQKAGCSKTFASTFGFNVSPCDLSPAIIFANDNALLIYDPNTNAATNNVTVTASGCSGAQISWEINGAFVSNANQVSLNSSHFPNQNNGTQTGIKLNCTKAYCQPISTTNYARLAHFDNCKTILQYSLSVSANQASHSGGGIQLTASGCPHTVDWSDGQVGSSITVYPNQNTTYSASCRIGDCPGRIYSNELPLSYDNPCTPYLNGPTIYPNGETARLFVAGCYNNEYLWNNGLTTSLIRVSNAGTYSVSCSNLSCGSYTAYYYWSPPYVEPDTNTGDEGNTRSNTVPINPPNVTESGGVTSTSPVITGRKVPRTAIE